MRGVEHPSHTNRPEGYPSGRATLRGERVDIGPLKRVIEVEPLDLPVPEAFPEPERIPDHEPAEPTK